MKFSKVLATATVLALACTPAFAGGFSYTSKGGNIGKWAYGDGQASGQINGFDDGWGAKAKNSSQSGTYSWVGTNEVRGESFGTNTLSFKGRGTFESTSSAFSGGGVGTGFGFKSGSISSGQ